VPDLKDHLPAQGAADLGVSPLAFSVICFRTKGGRKGLKKIALIILSAAGIVMMVGTAAFADG
jgi:hypothetical protein